MIEHINVSPDQVWRDNQSSHRISGNSEAPRGGFTKEQADDLGFRSPEEIDDTVAPSASTLLHWSENTAERVVGSQIRLYAIGEDGEAFAYIVRKGDNIADDMMQLFEKADEVRRNARDDEQPQGLDVAA